MKDLETKLIERLDRRADQLPVMPDLDGVLSRSARSVRPTGRRAPFGLALAGAAATLVVAVLGIGSLVSEDETEKADQVGPMVEPWPPNESISGLPTFHPEADRLELNVWMDSDRSPAEVDAVRTALDGLSLVDQFRYEDQEAIYQEFADYYADQPEALDLIEPEQLPTAFRVTTNDPAAVGWLIEPLSGISAIFWGDDRAASIGGLDDRSLIIWLDEEPEQAHLDRVLDRVLEQLTASEDTVAWMELYTLSWTGTVAKRDQLDSAEVVDRGTFSGAIRVITEDPEALSEALAGHAGMEITLGTGTADGADG